MCAIKWRCLHYLPSSGESILKIPNATLLLHRNRSFSPHRASSLPIRLHDYIAFSTSSRSQSCQAKIRCVGGAGRRVPRCLLHNMDEPPSRSRVPSVEAVYPCWRGQQKLMNRTARDPKSETILSWHPRLGSKVRLTSGCWADRTVGHNSWTEQYSTVLYCTASNVKGTPPSLCRSQAFPSTPGQAIRLGVLDLSQARYISLLREVAEKSHRILFQPLE